MRRRRKTEHGAAALEFAIVLPILVLILLGIINFAVVFSQNLTLNNGAREAARFAAVEGTTCTQIQSHIDGIQGLALVPADIATTIDPGCSGSSQPCEGTTIDTSVEVTLDYTSEFLIPFPIPGFPDSVDLTGKGEFRCEFS